MAINDGKRTVAAKPGTLITQIKGSSLQFQRLLTSAVFKQLYVHIKK